MENLVVGNKECTIRRVVQTMKDSPTSGSVTLRDWRNFARALDIDIATIHSLHEKSNLGVYDYTDVLENILICWKSRESKKSTLNALIQALEENCGWNDIAEALRSITKAEAKCWDHLDNHSQDEILHAPVNFQGRTTSLYEISEAVGIQKLHDILRKYLVGNVLKEALGNSPWKLDSIERNNQPPYYIKRTLNMQCKLDPNIFKTKCEDVFVFKNISSNELSKLAQPENTDHSVSQVDNLNVRFIILDCDDDFEILCRKSNTSVHKIQHDNGYYRWIGTSGSMAVVQKYLKKETVGVPEKEMVKRILSVFNTTPIAIADSPGIGKTRLLLSIAQKMSKQYPNRYILNISLPDLFSSDDVKNMSSLHSIKRMLAKYASSNELSNKILFELMNIDSNKFEIFMDSFDEIDPDQIPFAKMLFRILSKSNNLRAHITTRLYMRDELEQCIGVCSWNMKQFTETDQVNFFVKHWRKRLTSVNEHRLLAYAKDFVKHFREQDFLKDDNEENEIAGVPLRCYMLAEVYEEDARRYVSGDDTQFEIKHKLTKLSEMYKMYIDSRFKYKPAADKEAIMNAHWKAAVKLIFPEMIDKLSNLFTSSDNEMSVVDPKTLLSIGILQSLEPLKFIHRTFAEYLVADFFVTKLLAHQSPHDFTNLTDFFFTNILATTTTTVGIKITYPIINEFINVLKSTSIWYQVNTEYQKLVAAMQMQHDEISISPPGEHEKEKYIRNLLIRWQQTNGNSSNYHEFVKLLRNKMEWPSNVIDRLFKLRSAQSVGYQHLTICHFIDSLLHRGEQCINFGHTALDIISNLTDAHKSTSKHTAIQFYQNTIKCVSRGHVTLFKLLKEISLYTVNYADLLEFPWPLLVVAAAEQDLPMFKEIFDFVCLFLKQELYQMNFKNPGSLEVSYSPIEYASVHGNYRVIEYLTNKYRENIASRAKNLIKLCVEYSGSNSAPILKKKIEIIKFLVATRLDCILKGQILETKNITVKQIITVQAHCIHVEIFLFLVEFGADRVVMFGELFFTSVLPYFTIEDVDTLVTVLIEKQLVVCMLEKNCRGNTSLASCLFVDKMTLDTLRKIHSQQQFLLDDVGSRSEIFLAVVLSKWQPDMIQTFVEILNCVDLRDHNDNTLLMYAALEKSLDNIKYLISKGANVNAFSSKGMSPLAMAIRVNKEDDIDPLLDS